MTRVIIGAADQSLARQLQATILEMEDTEIASVAANTTELTQAVLREDADVLLVHEDLGPDAVLPLLRDLGVRRPASASLLLVASVDADAVTAAMDAGARGIVPLPLSFAQLQGRLTSAAEWSAQIRRMLAAGPTQTGYDDSTGRGKIVGFAGSKGGVGVTTMLTHLAMDISRTVPSLQVCLIDLDLEKGDVPGLIEVRHRIGIADLAKVADDLSPGTVADAMTRHDSGIDLLLAPLEIRDVEHVTPVALRQVLTAVRREYDLVLIDLGAHVTPAQATALEMADEIVIVVNPDVASLRGMRRTFNAWESLGVCKETDVRVLMNRASKQVTVSLETVKQLTRAAVLPTVVQASFRRLEPAVNARSPLELRNPQWWSDLRRAGRDIGLVPQAAADTKQRPPQSATVTRKGRRAKDAGSVAIETVGVLPFFGIVLAVVWHIAMLGLGTVLQSNAAAAATREYSMSGSATQAEDAAQDSLPAYLSSRIRVSEGARPDTLRVSMDVPGVVTGLPGMPKTVTTDRVVVREP